MRIVADTGILVRGPAKATGPARELLLLIRAGGHTLILSPFLLEQTRRVLSYPRMQKLFGLTEQEIEMYIQFLQDAAESVDPVVEIRLFWPTQQTTPSSTRPLTGALIFCAPWIEISMPRQLWLSVGSEESRS